MGRRLIVQPQRGPLRGVVTVPGDKSVSHRAVILAALAEGTSYIRGWLPAGDTLATLAIMQQLGITVRIEKVSETSWNLEIDGRGLHGLQPPEAPLDCRNAGTCMRLLAGVLAGQHFPTQLDGSAQLRLRPMGRILDPLQQMGADLSSQNGRAPLQVMPAPLHGISYTMGVASAQVKSAVLLAGLYAAGRTRIYQPGPARDHTERMLTAMGVEITDEGGWLSLEGDPHRRLQPLDLTVPSDISSAAFPFVAAALIPDSAVTIANCGMNETRTGIIDLLAAMGVEFTLTNERETGGEPAADVLVRGSRLQGTAVGGDVVVRAIDEFPIWTVAASQAAGRSTVRGAAELRVKEVDRISVLAAELRKMGVVLNEFPDGFALNGPTQLRGTELNSHDDHRLGMSLAVAGLVADQETHIVNAGCIADSFPGFVPLLQQLGAVISWED